jgi:hypothetical protein
MSADEHGDTKSDGTKTDPNAGRVTPGNQARPMTEDEAADTSSNDSMDASDPPAIPSTHGHDPAPSSLSPEEADKREADRDTPKPSKAEGEDETSPPTEGSPRG